MVTTNNRKIVKILLNSAGKASPDMTHNISMLGDGNMANGLVMFYRYGQLDGIIVSVFFASISFAIYKVGSTATKHIQYKREIFHAYQSPIKRCSQNGTSIADNYEHLADTDHQSSGVCNNQSHSRNHLSF